nr:MAG TPA: tail protein [Caudoviricetes sp.]
MKTYNEIDIKYYDNDGNIQVRCSVPVTQDALVHYELMQSHYCKLSFKLSKPIYFLLGDFIDTPYGRFELIDLTKAKDNDTIGYSYEIQFDAYYRKFKNKILKYRPNTGSQEATFSLTSTISTHVEVIMKSLSYYAKLDKSYLYDSKFDGEGTDYTYVIDASVDANAAKLITYSNSSMLDAIANIAQTFGCEWWFEGNILHFGTCENTNAITDFRLNDNIVSMSSSQSQSTYANRVYAFGAARNLPSGYKNDADADITKDGVVEKRLMLPNSAECSDKNKQLLAENGFELKNGYIQVSGLREDQYVEGVTTNDDIYPRNLIKTSKVTSYEKDVEDESTPEEGDFIKRTFYRVNSLSIINEDGEKTGDMAFRKSYILSGKNLHIVFQSGSLNGMDFECEFNPDGVEEILKDDDGNPILKDGKEQINPMSQVFEIVANEDYGRFLPDITLHPKDGDTFVLYNWDSTKLGDTLVSSASNELLTDAIKDLKKSMIDPTTYTCTAEANYSYNQGRGNLHGVGDRVNLYNKGYGDSYRASRIIGYEFCLDIPYDGAKYYVGEKPSYSRLNAMESKIEELVYNGQSYLNGNGGGGKSIYIIKSYDKTAPTDYNVYSAKAIDEQRLNRTKDDTAHGTITFEKVQKFLKGLNIGDGNGAWSADGTLSLFRLLTNNFSSGLYGQGAQIDEKGNIEANSIYARQFISAPKFVFNEISVTKAEQWNTNGYGTIESVDVENRTITLHLEENDYGSLQVGDICRGLYADIDNAHGADKIEEGALDDCNFVQHKGFFSTYFYVTHIITNEKGKFVFQYGKKSSVTPDPCAYMDFAQYGSFTDEKRQSSMYFSSRGNSYIEVLDGVCTWEVQPQNRVARYGWLGGLALVKKDGSIVRPEGNGIYVQDNIYFGGNINYLQGLSGLDDLREEANAYDVSLSQYQSVITVDDMGNVINGLYTEDEEKTTKQYRISTAVFVRKGMDILLEEEGNTEDVTAGHYRVHAVSEDCEVMVQNSTIFVTAIRNIKDGVAGTKDDATFDYDAMRKATDAMVTIVVELEGKTSKMVQMPIRIQHDTLPFMVCDLSNESASVAWNTKTAKYIGLPIKTKVSLLYHNEPWAISSLNISKVAGLKTSMSIEGKEKVITIDADNLTADTLAQVTKMNITVVGRYAGANYEYTRELTILKSSDTVVYELIPSADSIVIDKDGNTTVNSVSCDVYATSSDDKRYKLTALPAGMSLKYGKSENATTSVGIGSDVPVSVSDKMVTFALYDSNNNMLDKESVPVVAFGKDGKGIEYIFKLQNSAPSNPTPSDYATNAEYQRTDKEFVPSGWTDDPTGVDAVNQYEWVCKRVSTNGHWGAFSEPAEYAHFGKHAPKAKSSDDIVTIPTDSDGNALLAFREEVGFSLLVDGHECNISSIQKYSSTLSNVSCSISSNVVTIKCEEGAKLGITSQTVVFKVTGTLDGSTYIDYVTVKVVPNVTGADGDGYEYIYYQSNYLNNDFSAPKRTNGKLTDGWQDDLMAPTEDKRYVFVAYKRGELGSDGEFSMPELFNRYPRSIISQETKFIAWHSLTDAPDANKIWYYGSTDMPKDFSDDKPWLWKVVRTNYTEGDPEYTVSCEGYKAKDGDGLIVGYQSSASEPSVLPTPKTLADYDKAQDDIGSGWTKTAPTTGGKSIVLGGKITTDEISDRYNSSTNAWGTEESEILLDGIKQKKTFYKTPSSLGNNGKCIRRIKVVNHFRDSYLRVMMKSYSETNWDLVCISRLYLPSEVINSDGNQIKEDSEYLNRSEYAYVVSGDGQSLVAELSMPDAGEYYFFIGYFKDGGTDSYGDYGLFAWQSMIALTESLWRTDGTVDAVGNITWSKAMPMQAEAIVMERAYIATTNDTKAPAKPYRTNGILQGGWTAKRLAVSSTNRFIWESVRAGKHGTDSVQDDWSQPVVVANFAEAGKMGKNGCIVRNSEGWKSGATYHNDSALTKEQKYIDLIYIEDNNANDGWSIYQCNVTHTATGSSFDPSAVDSDKNKLWTKLSDTGPMYSPLIVAKNAVLKFAQGQQFNLMEGNNIFGSFRWVKDDVDYAFWIGGTEGSNATTSITRGGKFKTTDADITGKITATSGQIGGFKLEDNNLVCSNARLAIGEERNSFTRMVVLDAKSFTYDSYNFALSVVNYGIVTQSSTTQAGIHINVGASNSSVQYPGIVMENGTFVGFRIPIVPLYYSMDLRNSASIYASGMCIRCNNSSSITITLPTSATGAKTGDVFTVIRAGTGDVTIKAPAGVSYRTSSGKTGEFTSTKKNEQIHLIFDGDTWFSECSAG